MCILCAQNFIFIAGSDVRTLESDPMSRDSPMTKPHDQTSAPQDSIRPSPSGVLWGLSRWEKTSPSGKEYGRDKERHGNQESRPVERDAWLQHGEGGIGRIEMHGHHLTDRVARDRPLGQLAGACGSGTECHARAMIIAV